MNKFNIGDRVQVVGDNSPFYHEFDVGVVKQILYDGLVIDVDFGKNHFRQRIDGAVWAVPYFDLARIPEAADDILDGEAD